jgi:type I restriction enzyme, S subunit
MINDLDGAATRLFNYWFIQFDFPDKDGRPYKKNGGSFKIDPISKTAIPQNWNPVSIKNLCGIVDCLHSKKPDQVFESEDFFLLQTENLVGLGLIDTSNKYYVTQDVYKFWTSRIEVAEGDLVVTNAGRAGDVCRIPFGMRAGIGRNMTAIRPQKIPPVFLYYFFKSPQMISEVRSNTDRGSFFNSLNVFGIMKLYLFLPSDDTCVRSFEKIASQMRQKIEALNQENEQLIRQKKLLLPLLLSGEIN